MTPDTTIGVCCVPTPANVHAAANRDTLVVLICVSFESLRPGKVARKPRPVSVGERLDAALPRHDVSADSDQGTGQNDWKKYGSHRRSVYQVPGLLNDSNDPNVQSARGSVSVARRPPNGDSDNAIEP